MLSEKVLEMVKLLFGKWVSYPTIKPFMIPWCHFLLVMSGKSSWVPSRTQGFVPTCCRWADVLRLLYQLSLSCDGWCLGPWAWSILTSHLMLLLEMILRWHCTWTLCECVCGFELNASATFIQTWFVITMFKLRCIRVANVLCNMWYVTPQVLGLHLDTCICMS